MIFKIVSSLNKILRKILVGNFRQEKISFFISQAIIEINKKKNIKILDFGSGFFKPSLTQITSENLKKNNLVSDFVCLDFYTQEPGALILDKRKHDLDRQALIVP